MLRFTLLLCVISFHPAFAQTDSAKTVHTPKSSDTLFENPGRKKTDYVALYFELAGNGVQLSYNLDVRLFSHLSFKAGYGAYAENGPKTFGVLVTMVNYLFFKEQSHIEVGLGTVTELKRDDCGTTVLPTSCAPVKGTVFLGVRYSRTSVGLPSVWDIHHSLPLMNIDTMPDSVSATVFFST